ncbi:hypothetical protein EJA72_07980 [Pseudomonas sp. PB120]|uniref:hypothetical protein n=1 Tax=Pseudomonas sp. PB120 TaxID=2494700 RepID=UPI0012FE5A49|nr:hypothetical protein [Pseudomonas sp. PB120]MVV48181.1 hypothetical protein [Pseudomonas sp. PB120]
MKTARLGTVGLIPFEPKMPGIGRLVPLRRPDGTPVAEPKSYDRSRSKYPHENESHPSPAQIDRTKAKITAHTFVGMTPAERFSGSLCTSNLMNPMIKALEHLALVHEWVNSRNEKSRELIHSDIDRKACTRKNYMLNAIQAWN